MNKGASLVEAMFSLFLGGFIVLAGNTYLLNVKGVGKKMEDSVMNVSERSLSLFQITSIIKKAGEKLPSELGVDIKNNILTIRKTVQDFQLIKDCSPGDIVIETNCSKCKKGKKFLVGKEIYIISAVYNNSILLDRGISISLKKDEKISLIKEYFFFSDSNGLYLKIDRGSFQLITKNLFNITFSMFSNSVIKLLGKERKGKRIQNFEYYIYLPYLSINGGLK